MNALNRILVVLAVLTLTVVCIVVSVGPVATTRVTGEWLQNAADLLEEIMPQPLLRVAVGVVLSLVWLFVGILLLILELRRPRARTVRMGGVDGGEVEVSLKTVGDHIAYAVDQLPGVLRTRSRVSSRKGGVMVELDVETAGDVNVPGRAAQVVDLVREVVEEKVGVNLAQPPKVHLQAQPTPPAARSRPGSE
ncbi:MAG: hypothetical protein JW900_06300 [Anaerolineae bacterium]|nr:hypothetical protein [Anaerolineae bacterium]